MNWTEISITLGKAFPYIVGLVFSLIALFAILGRKKTHQKSSQVYAKTVKKQATEPHTLHPEIDPAKCAGCGACVKVCPEGDILQLFNHRAKLVEPSKCVGHGECERACPFDAISLVFGTKTKGMELPRLTRDFETNVPGLYIAGELGGMGLIRNAVKQGAMAANHALNHLPPEKADTDLLVVGAGASGLSASLAAIEKKRSYICIEQDKVGGTIYHFPRQKVVMSHAAKLPIVGTMKFPSNKVSKESLLEYWSQVRHSTGLKVKENCKFLNLEKHGNIFHVQTSIGNLTARKVVLCMGVRGSPRKLGVPGEESSKVTYNLIEPEQYRGMELAISGAGNSAMEAAIALANPRLQNHVTLLIRGGAITKANEENTNQVLTLAKARRIKLCYETTVKEVKKESLIVQQKDQLVEIKNQYVFVLIGAEMPFSFLRGLGVKIEKKFGEPRSS